MSSAVQEISDFINDGPFLWVYLFLFVGVSIRAQATYGIGRYMNHFVMNRGKPQGGWRLDAYNWIHSEGTQRGVDIVRRRGWPAVTLCFITVGLQTAILIGSGIIGMSWLRFTLAMIPGALIWAAIYSTIGWAVWEATVLTALGSPIGIAVLIGLLLLLILFIHYRRTKKKHRDLRAESEDGSVFDDALAEHGARENTAIHDAGAAPDGTAVRNSDLSGTPTANRM